MTGCLRRKKPANGRLMFGYVTRSAYEIRHRHIVNRLFYIHRQLSLVGGASASVFVCFHRQAPSTKKDNAATRTQ
jgi:hypothetical protein